MKPTNTSPIRPGVSTFTTLALAALASWVTGSAVAQTINVNFEQYTPSPGTPPAESTLVGPAGGLATRWNQFAANKSSGPLVDSTGATTTVEFTTNFSEGRAGGGGNTPMLRSTLTDFGRGQSRTLTITGLDAGAVYDVYLASFRDSTSEVERTVGTWSTSNTTASPNSQTIDNRGVRNGTTFVDGYNYVEFQNVEADGTGKIVFNGQGLIIDLPIDGNDYRLGLSGFQITPSPHREPLRMTAIAYDDASDEVSLTWRSNPGEFYGIYWSEDLKTFVPGVNPAVPAHATDPETSYGPFPSPIPNPQRLFFRIGPPDLEDPVLQSTWGSGSTITLNFSEAMHAAGASELANYTVVKNGSTPVTVSGVELSEDGKTITLTLAAPLDVGTAYSVTMNNLTDLAGRPLGNGTQGVFQTYDNNPAGVKVFILAGQSNMVGHGKSEHGLGDVAGAIGSLRYLAVNNASYPEFDYSQLLVDPANPATSAWKTRSDVKVWWRDSDVGQPRAVIKGDLGIGYSQSRNSAWFGPEYAFGWVMGDHYPDNPVLLIKTAWGGKSLHVDFRPPSAVAARGGAVGPYYTGMIEYVRDCLSKLGTEFPEFVGMGYQIAGFGWHQGWNDRVNANYAAEYEDNLVDLIHDLRAEFGRPDLPVSIGTTGMAPTATYGPVELAQLAVADPAQHPEFTGTVFTVDTRPFWRDSTVSPSSFGYHWNHNGESHFLVGDAMGRGIQQLLTP